MPVQIRPGAQHEQVLAEIGTDMSRFPMANHPASWAGLCPGNNESAGKRKGGRSMHGNRPGVRQIESLRYKVALEAA